MLVFAPHVGAQTTTQSVAQELQSSRVFVDPDIPESTDTARQLIGSIRDGDQLAVVILEDHGEVDASSFARALALQMPDTAIAVIDSNSYGVVSNSSWPNQIVAEDILKKSANVTQNPKDTLAFFIQRVHRWQDDNPKPVPPAPPVPPNHTPIYLGGGAVVLAGVGAAGYFIIKRRNKRSMELYGAPRQYRRTLKKILSYRDKFGRDSETGAIITKICELSVRYFQGESTDDAAILHHHLQKNVPEFLKNFWASKQTGISREDYQNGLDALREFLDFTRDINRKGVAIKTDDLNRTAAALKDARNSIILP